MQLELEPCGLQSAQKYQCLRPSCTQGKPLEPCAPQTACCNLGDWSLCYHHRLDCATPALICLAGDGEGSLTIRRAHAGGDAETSAATGEETLLVDRLAWSMVTRTHPWDCVTRLRQLCVSPLAATAAAAAGSGGEEGSGGDGSAALRTALARVDDMLHAQGHHSRPHYAALLAARKVRISSFTPSLSARCTESPLSPLSSVGLQGLQPALQRSLCCDCGATCCKTCR